MGFNKQLPSVALKEFEKISSMIELVYSKLGHTNRVVFLDKILNKINNTFSDYEKNIAYNRQTNS